MPVLLCGQISLGVRNPNRVRGIIQEMKVTFPLLSLPNTNLDPCGISFPLMHKIISIKSWNCRPSELEMS